MDNLAKKLMTGNNHRKYAAIENELHLHLWAAREQVLFYNRLCNWFVRNKVCCKLDQSSSYFSQTNTVQNNVLYIFIQIQIFTGIKKAKPFFIS